MQHPEESPEVRHGVRQYLLELAHDNPIDIDVAMTLNAFPTRNAGNVWFQRQESAGNLRCVGFRKDAQGRKVIKVFCNGWQPKDDNLRHEVLATMVRILYPAYRFERGYKLNDCFPDSVMTDGEHTFEIEIDCGTMKRLAVQRRARRHKCHNEVLFVVAPKIGDPDERLKRVMEWSEGLGERGFFTTLARLQELGPHARVWDWIGRGEQPLKRVKMPVASAYQDYINTTPQTATGQEDSDMEEMSD